MTLNWGHKITIVLIAFGVLMTTLVYKSIKTDFQLVSKDYYKDELNYQQVIDGSNNAALLSSALIISPNKNGISIQFPVEMKNKNIKGELWFYCPYEAAKDRRIKINTTVDGVQLMATGEITSGNYIVKTSWQADGSSYYNEQSLTVQ
jgi:hypothetical protein